MASDGKELTATMHVIITMAGHSRRFQDSGYRGPKALLPCGDRTMIEHAINMFDTVRDVFYIVLNRQQSEENPELLSWLKSRAANINPVVIDIHEKGPVHSALAVSGIPDDAEVVISYCDFFVDWDYRQFVREVHGADGAIVSFRGFHPASFGSTYYAYMRVDGDRMLELREKRAFTSERELEHASAGIYYFGSWSLFKEYGSRILDQKDLELPEAYVSLLYNPMVGDGLHVVIHEARRFICLGTPEDYEQYCFWWKYFNNTQVELTDPGRGVERVALLPMAGRGSRFKAYGYRVVKPLIQVSGVPMMIRAAKSFPQVDRWVCLPRADDLTKHPIIQALETLNGKLDVLGVDHETSGQAATCLLAADYITDDAEVLIASCDYEHRYQGRRWQTILDNKDIDGAIWTYRTRGLPVKNPEAFAYCILGDDNETVTEIVEKATISDTPHLDSMVVGTFWFRRARDYKYAARSLIDKDIRINGEHYIGTSINQLLQLGRRFVIFEIDQWISFGDPFELKVMEYWQDHFVG